MSSIAKKTSRRYLSTCADDIYITNRYLLLVTNSRYQPQLVYFLVFTTLRATLQHTLNVPAISCSCCWRSSSCCSR